MTRCQPKPSSHILDKLVMGSSPTFQFDFYSISPLLISPRLHPAVCQFFPGLSWVGPAEPVRLVRVLPRPALSLFTPLPAQSGKSQQALQLQGSGRPVLASSPRAGGPRRLTTRAGRRGDWARTRLPHHPVPAAAPWEKVRRARARRARGGGALVHRPRGLVRRLLCSPQPICGSTAHPTTSTRRFITEAQ